MKFGGSSVDGIDRIKYVAQKIISKKKNNEIVVVVSASGNSTDNLIKKAKKITSFPSLREMDMLLATGEMVSTSLLTIMLNSMGQKAISMTGPQAGILADNNYTCAKIKKIKINRIKNCLLSGNIVIVAGFQALNVNGDITTLGRGGSDLTAIALSASLKANLCEIYSDVEGVYTADPNIVKTAKKIDCLSYDEMLEMAGAGAQILQPRSIIVAKKFGIVIHARNTFSKNPGTVITSEQNIRRKNMETLLISGITSDKNRVKFTVRNLPKGHNIVLKIFDKLAKVNIDVDMIIQSSILNKKNDIIFTVNKQNMEKTQTELNNIFLPKLNFVKIIRNERIAKISIIGVGIKENYNVIAKMFNIFYKNKINIEMINTSETIISCIVDKFNMIKAVKELHESFEIFMKR
jgi:aspartate kinase